jgi:hypothetical protein
MKSTQLLYNFVRGLWFKCLAAAFAMNTMPEGT